jgi:DNA-directed RNA polymerase subunit RPC12/RpoP
MKIVDVTEIVDFVAVQNTDDDIIPITMCVCGKRFEPNQFSISMYEKNPYECPECGAKLFFGNAVRVYQVVEE